MWLGRFWPGLWMALASTGILLSFSAFARPQTLPQVLPSLPPVPVTESQNTPPPPAAQTIEELGQQLRALDLANKKLAQQLEQSNREHEVQIQQLLEKSRELSDRLGSREPNEAGTSETPRIGVNDPGQSPGSPVPDYTEDQLYPFLPAPGFPDSNVSSSQRTPLKATFGPGFQFQSEDERFRLQIHYESQIETRSWLQSSDSSAQNGFYMPRQRIFFTGNITKPIEYELAINRGLNNINLLNAFINLHLDDCFEVKIGRFFTPFPYDQYAVSNYWLLTPERSLFTTNLGTNRQIGAMAWGYLADERLDYAAGVFNGGRNSFENLDNFFDLVAYINARPFQESESFTFARFLNVGTSVALGRQDASPSPSAFRIGAGSPDSNTLNPAFMPFLILNPDVVEKGPRLMGSVHTAYFYKGLSLMAEWQYGFGNYASLAQPSSVEIPFSGFYVTSGYFLTGEEVERRTRVKPKKPLIPVNKDEPRGLGAWELAGRVSQLELGDKIFTAGFADSRLWSNSATTTELGMNWYWNEYMKIYMFWLHANFGDPVTVTPGQPQKSADMLWVRCQLYF